MSVVALHIPQGKLPDIADSITRSIHAFDPQCNCQELLGSSVGKILAVTLSDAIIRTEAQRQNLSLLEKSGTSLPYRDEYKQLFATFPTGTIFSPSEQLLVTVKALQAAPLSASIQPTSTAGTIHTLGEYLSFHGVQLIPVHDAGELTALREAWGLEHVLPGSPAATSTRAALPVSLALQCQAVGLAAFQRLSAGLRSFVQRPVASTSSALGRAWALLQWLALTDQPLDNIRDYFGENVAFYFAFGQAYTRWLLVPAVVGVLTWWCQHPASASQTGEHARANALFTSAFALFLSIWSTLFLKNWRRAQSELAYTWCVLGQSSIEQPRPQFKADYVLVHPVTGVAEPQETTAKHLVRFFTFTVPSMSGLLFGGLLSLLWAEQFRHVLKRAVDEVLLAGFSLAQGASVSAANSHNSTVADRLHEVIAYLGFQAGSKGSWFTQLIPMSSTQLHPLVMAAPALIRPYLPLLHTILVQIITAVLMAVGRFVAEWSTERENHKLASSAAGSLTAKLVLVSSVLTFVPLLYIAFVEQDLVLLGQRLLFALLWGAVISTVTETGVPLLQRMRAGRGQASAGPKAGNGHALAELAAAKEVALGKYDPYDDMLELFTQYGLLSLFAPVFPLAPLLAYLNNLQEARADAIKICALQRPVPEKVSGLGAWNSAFELMGYASVLTQAGLIGVATAQADWPEGLPAIARAVLVILVEHLIIALKVMVDAQVADVPESVTLRVMREQMLRPQIVWAAMRSQHTNTGARRQSVTQGAPTGRARRMIPSETTYDSGPAPASAGSGVVSTTRTSKGFWADGQGQEAGQGTSHVSTASGTPLEPLLHAQSRMASLAGLGESGLGVAAGTLASDAMAASDRHIMANSAGEAKAAGTGLGAGAELRRRVQAPGSSSGETSIVSRW